jgi:hypothetical protein
MKAVLSLAYISSVPSLGTVNLSGGIFLGTVKSSETSKPTIVEELLIALGRIQTTSATFSTLNMASPLIKSLNLDLIMRRHSNPFDQLDLEDTLHGFEIKKAFEDIPQLSDVAGKLVDKAPFLDYFSVAEYSKNQPMKKLEDIAFARAELLPFKVEKGLVDVLTFEEALYLNWSANLILESAAELDDLAQFLYQPTLQTFIGSSDYIEPVRAVLSIDQAHITTLAKKGTNKSLFDETHLEDSTKTKTLKRLLDVAELDELIYPSRIVLGNDTANLEDAPPKKLFGLAFKAFKRPYLQYGSHKNYTQFTTTATTGGGGNANRLSAGQGPLTDRDTELAVIESSRWHDNEFKGIGVSFDLKPRLKDVAELDELIYPSRIVFRNDTANLEDDPKKFLNIGVTKYKRPYLHLSKNVYFQRYSNNTYSEGTNYLYTRSAGDGTFTDRDTELAVVESARWHDNEFKGIGVSLDMSPRLKDVVELDENVLANKIHLARDTVNAEHLVGRFLSTDFIIGRSFEEDSDGNKTWSDGLLDTVYVPGPAVYTETYAPVSQGTYEFYQRNRSTDDFLLLNIRTNTGQVAPQYPYYRVIQVFSYYEPGYYTKVARNPTQVNNSRMTERDGELLSGYAGRDQMSFGLPLTLEPELFSARTDYVLPVKVILNKEKAILEADISDLFMDLKIIDYEESVYPRADTALIEGITGKFVDKATFLDEVASIVDVLPAKVILPEGEQLTALATLENKTILLKVKASNVTGILSPISSFDEFAAGLSVKNTKDTLKKLNENVNAATTSNTFRPVFSFDFFKASDTDAREIQKQTTEELLSTISTFYRQVNYKRDYQAENALADDTFSAFSQNYSSGYFSQAYVGSTIIGD